MHLKIMLIGAFSKLISHSVTNEFSVVKSTSPPNVTMNYNNNNIMALIENQNFNSM